MTVDIVFLPLHWSGPSSESLFYFDFLMLTLPMFLAMFGLFLLKWTKIDAMITGSAWWVYPVFYAGFPVGIWLYNLRVYGYPEDYAFFAALLPPVLGFLQASFLDSEKNWIYLLAFITSLLSFRGIMTARSDEVALVLPLIVSPLLLVYVIWLKYIRKDYNQLLIPALFLTIIISPIIVLLLLEVIGAH